MRSLILATLATLGLAAMGIAQTTAAVNYYGAACRNYNNTVNAPVMQVTGLPQLGATITLRYIGPNSVPSNKPVLITGTSSLNAAVPRLTQAMAANCTLLVNPDIAVFFMPQSTGVGGYLDRISYTVPNNPSVIGGSLYHQWMTMVFGGFDPQNPTFLYLMLSNGVQIRAGL